ncbi:MAG: ribonucleotide-diphosphate reductase subunit alpha, partial [Bacteroidetes bacterium]|nr:ribonucleotide-diphosphate reductase subunit alpha [Bacteroidota bacterium]
MDDQYASVINPVQLSHNAYRILENRYLRRNEAGELELAEELFQRVARKVAQAELVWGTWSDSLFWEERFFEILCDLKFLPNSPTLMNAGTPSNQLSACFVLPIEDSLEAIFST